MVGRNLSPVAAYMALLWSLTGGMRPRVLVGLVLGA